MARDPTPSSGQGIPRDGPKSELPQSVLAPGAPPGRQDGDSETWHVSFRAFTGSQESDPVSDLRRLWELCHLWLRPDLHTKEQILDKLVMEQFMISMPLELQALVSESGVESCRDLEAMLRSDPKSPKKWTIVTVQGQRFLLRNSDVQMAEAEDSDADNVMDLSQKPQPSVSNMHPERSQGVGREPRTLPGINEMSRGQGQEVLLPETMPAKGGLGGPRPQQTLERELMEGREEPQLQKGPEDSEGARRWRENCVPRMQFTYKGWKIAIAMATWRITSLDPRRAHKRILATKYTERERLRALFCVLYRFIHNKHFQQSCEIGNTVIPPYREGKEAYSGDPRLLPSPLSAPCFLLVLGSRWLMLLLPVATEEKSLLSLQVLRGTW
ncbi:Zinc finger and SCAN domain-containing protein 5B [Manis javanica]|nr:Zinc finger and SCAN domain-containing protein 5B [Manis javanica]